MFRIIRSVSSRNRLIIRGVANSTVGKVGHGPHTVLCIPGFLGTIEHFKPQVDGFDREKFTLVVWEPPGFGKSRPPEKKFDPDVYERDAHIAYEFMKILNISKYSILGWSSGGVNGMILAAKYPKTVMRLVVSNGFSYILPHEINNYRRAGKLLVENQNKKRIADDGHELVIKYCDMVIRDTLKIILQERGGNICKELLKNISCPTYILYGQKDPIVDGVHGSYLHANIKGSRKHVYPDGDHVLHIKCAEDFNNRVQEFLMLP